MSLARTGNVDVNGLYSYFTNDTVATNNIISIGGQVTNQLSKFKCECEVLGKL